MIYRTFDDLATTILAEQKVKCCAVVGAEADHALEAVIDAMNAGIIKPILCGDKGIIENKLTKLGQDLSLFPIVDCATPDDSADAAISLVKEGKADFIMKGQIETAPLMKHLFNKESGLKTDNIVHSLGFAQIETYHKLLVTTDAAIMTSPTVEDKKRMVQQASDIMHKMGWDEVKVAVMSAVEKVNPKIQSSIDAAEVKALWEKGEITGCIVEGPIALDLALVKEAAELKNYSSPVAGEADLMIYPDISAGNIAMKTLTMTGHNQTGSVIVGLQCPIVMSSRGASRENKYRSILVAAAMA